MKTIHVNLSADSYNIYIGKDILAKVGEIFAKDKEPCKTLLITDENIEKIYGDVVAESFRHNNFDVKLLSLPPGEEQKNIENALLLYDNCFAHKLDRKSLIVALGGGVVGDLSGFIAATFMRGIPYIQIPTSLLAQVDSSIGGKVAVNHPKGKNMIGCFYQPKAVFIDTNTLSSLPSKEMVAGIAEVIKYGVIRDVELFAFLEKSMDAILQLQYEALLKIIATSCQIKAHVVEQDEKENDLRAILNYGHTIGHAIETVTHYKRYRHGEAVAIGMLYATKIAIELGIADTSVFDRQLSIMKNLGLSIQTGLKSEDIIKALYTDKKTVSGRLRFVLPTKIGEVIISDKVNDEMLYRILDKPLLAF